MWQPLCDGLDDETLLAAGTTSQAAERVGEHIMPDSHGLHTLVLATAMACQWASSYLGPDAKAGNNKTSFPHVGVGAVVCVVVSGVSGVSV